MIKSVKGIIIPKMSAARPTPPSASMGKLSLEDDNARKSNANGPSGKDERERENRCLGCVSEAILRDAEPIQESNIGILTHDAGIVQTALLVTQLALFVPQSSSAPHPLRRGRENVLEPEVL